MVLTGLNPVFAASQGHKRAVVLQEIGLTDGELEGQDVEELVFHERDFLRGECVREDCPIRIAERAVAQVLPRS